jgi:hypothetical protein
LIGLVVESLSNQGVGLVKYSFYFGYAAGFDLTGKGPGWSRAFSFYVLFQL